MLSASRFVNGASTQRSLRPRGRLCLLSWIAGALTLISGASAEAGTGYCRVWIDIPSDKVEYGTKVNATVTLSPNSGLSGADMGAGTITLRIRGGATLGTTTLTASGSRFTGSIDFNGVAPGEYGLEAGYSGDGVLMSCSNLTSEIFQDLTVTKASSSATIDQSSESTDLGEAVTFTARVSKDVSARTGVATPSGNVIFYVDGKKAATAKIAEGKAQLRTSDLKAGKHTISASYSGDNRYKSNDSAKIVHSVGSSSADIRLLPESAPSGTVGQAYDLRFYVRDGAAPYRIKLVDGVLPPGLSFDNGRVAGIPTRKGVYPMTVSAIDANGLRDRVRVSIQIGNVSEDTLGVLEAERRSARRLGEAQIDAVLDRLAALHGACAYNSINITLDGGAISQEDSTARTTCDAALGFWLRGNYVSGARDQSGLQPALDYGTSGFTAGVDRRIDSSLVVGASVGMGFDHTDIGTNGSNSDARAMSAALYGGWEVQEKTYLDGLIGYNRLDFDVLRYAGAGHDFARYDRRGDQVFAAMSAMRKFDLSSAVVSPYLRLKSTATRLDAAHEQGAGAENLTYLSLSDFTTTASVGVQIERVIETDFGVIRPFAGLEYQREILGDATQNAFRTASPKDRFSVDLDTVSDDLFSAQLGVDWSFTPSASLGASYSAGSDFTDNWMQSFQAHLTMRF